MLFFFSALGSLFLSFVVASGAFIWHVQKEWSPLIEPRIQETQQGSIRVSAEGRWIGSFSNGRLEERKPVRLAELPPQLVQAIVVLEDPRFLNHEGIDLLGILRALYQNLKSLRYAQGGSTITQQLVKNVFLSHEKTIRRKLIEAALAALVEKRFSKDEILEAYMNEVYMGQVGGLELHGVGRAAEYYFGREPGQLELHEMALLAAIINSPGLYNPWRNPERALARRNRALRALADAKLILEEEYTSASKRELPAPSTYVSQVRAPYLMDALRTQLLDLYSEAELIKGGFDIPIALDVALQQEAEESIANASKKWPREQQAILLAAETKTCTIKIYIGGSDYQQTQLDRNRQSRRPIGSLIKPLLVQGLLEKDPALHLQSKIDDVSTEWVFDGGRNKWRPQNYDKKFRGPVSLRQTLEDSLNVPIVRLFQQINPSGLLWNELDSLRALGIPMTQERALPSALLGALEASPLEVLEAYLKLNRMALGMAPNAADPECKPSFVVKNSPPSEGEELSYGQASARMTLAALEGALRRGTSATLGRTLPPQMSWAGKTGTSSDSRDAWYVALSPEMVIVSWVGRDDNGETRLTGATGALPLVTPLVHSLSQREGARQNWPQSADLEYLPWLDSKNCIDAGKLSRLKEKFGEIERSTPPPETLLMDGEKYVVDLFRKNSAPLCN